MTAAEIVDGIRNDGLMVTAEAESIKLAGRRELVAHWAPIGATAKIEILRLLSLADTDGGAQRVAHAELSSQASEQLRGCVDLSADEISRLNIAARGVPLPAQ
ncbi:MAG: hypothetical protein H7Z43_08860, partial [Clostridia bacterium]|nr:hypothetical protein [Deltaproteobacteria bacterium]